MQNEVVSPLNYSTSPSFRLWIAATFVERYSHPLSHVFRIPVNMLKVLFFLSLRPKTMTQSAQ